MQPSVQRSTRIVSTVWRKKHKITRNCDQGPGSQHILASGTCRTACCVELQTVLSLRDGTHTATSLLQKQYFNPNVLPPPLAYGRKHEEMARQIKGHKYHHQNCPIKVPGLIVRSSCPFLGCSPDGVVTWKLFNWRGVSSFLTAHEHIIGYSVPWSYCSCKTIE